MNHSTTANVVLGFTTVMINRDSPRSPSYNPKLSHHDLLLLQLNRSIERSRHLEKLHITENPIAALGNTNGQYFIEVGLGTPHIQYDLLLDTGSPLTWIQGPDCEMCENLPAWKFDPTSSTSFNYIFCNKPECDVNLGYMYCYGSDCRYEIQYEDNTTSTGEMYKDTFTFISVSGEFVPLKNVEFGVADTLISRTFSKHFSGLFGLNRGPRFV
jgi:Xylanase inhibitor N-terminal